MAKEKLTIVKIGGDIVDNDVLLASFFENIKEVSGPKIIVHGGGNRASALQKELGIAPKKIEGRRVTDEATLEIVTMVYAGLLNKKLVSKLQALNDNAVGLSGADGDSIRAHKRIVDKIDYGFAGDIDQVNVRFIHDLLFTKKTPVFSPITHDGNGQLLNTNADTLAARIASAMSLKYDTELFYCFTKPGVLRDVDNDDSVVEDINIRNYLQLKQEGVVTDGMVPKLDTAFEALNGGVKQVHLGLVDILSNTALKHTTLCL